MYPEVVRQAFLPLSLMQMQVGRAETIMAYLLSIRTGLLEK